MFHRRKDKCKENQKRKRDKKTHEKMFDANDWIWQIDVLYLVSSDNSLTVWTFTSYFLMLICLDSFQLMLSMEWKKVWKNFFHQKPSSYITHIYTVTVRHHVRFFHFIIASKDDTRIDMSFFTRTSMHLYFSYRDTCFLLLLLLLQTPCQKYAWI